ncbi:MAG: hydantoinase/oxoprolinase family protein, partial [Isosphaeraceae bacterium]
MSSVAIDIGGTFTDLVLVDDDGALLVGKTPTTRDPVDGVVKGVLNLCRVHGVPSDGLDSMTYGTTAAVNALLTRSGARVGLLTTQGFGQILHLARSQTPGPIVAWMNMVKPDPLADLSDTREVPERMRASGQVDVELDPDPFRQAVGELIDRGVEALAVGFLHSYANPQHEELAAELIREVAPEIDVSLSSQVHREYREYERVVTTVANAYVMPTVSQHLNGLQERLEAENLDFTVSIVRSDGGVMSAAAAAERPIDTVFSGPSGGVEGALASVSPTGLSDILTLDMGGTSTDVSVCLGGKVAVARETIVADLPLKAPSVDVRSIGAGGGSIAQVPDSINSLRVGPESAGADPGPASYGRGGKSATVTDANLVLGRLPTGLLGGEFPL